MIRLGSISDPSLEIYLEMLTTQVKVSQADTLLTVLLIVTITMMVASTVEIISILPVKMSLEIGTITIEALKHSLHEMSELQVPYFQEN